jgi:transposase
MTRAAIQTERIDDVPLLVRQQQKMGIPRVIDAVIQPHGKRRGLSVGWTVVGWLTYILSESDHRMSYVEPWVENRLRTLKGVIAARLRVRDFTDDRLGDVLRYLSKDEDWEVIEEQLGQHLIRVYSLPAERLWLDSTTASLYHDTEGSVLFRHGHSKDHRPDLPQLKVMLSALYPLGVPLTTRVVPGNVADDGLYLPTIHQARQVIQQQGLLYLADNKMESLSVRADLAANGDYYLVPLSGKGNRVEWLCTLLQPVWEGRQGLTDIYRDPPDRSEQQLIAQAYETTRWQEAKVNDQLLRWQERVLVVYSPAWAQRAYKGLSKRLQRAEERLLALTPEPGRGKRQKRDLGVLQKEADAILKQHRVVGLLQVSYQQQATQRHIRKYKEHPARTEEQVRCQVEVSHDEAAIQEAYRILGWRLYVTNTLVEQLPLPEAILTYRSTPIMERGFSRLKGRPLGLRPFYVQREDHVKGLVRLLTLALRVLAVTEFTVRCALQRQNRTLAGLYAGNPKRSTGRPTTERLLKAFKEITLTTVEMPGQFIRHVTPLTELQSRILRLLGLSPSTYSDLAVAIEPIPP